MPNLCARCAQQAFRYQSSVTGGITRSCVRSFSASRPIKQNGADDSGNSRSNSGAMRATGNVASGQYRQQSPPGRVLSRRGPTGGSSLRQQSEGNAPGPRRVLQRVSSPQPGQLLRRNPTQQGGEARLGPGNVLRRSGASQRPSTAQQKRKPSRDKRRGPAKEEEDDEEEEELRKEVDRYVRESLDRSPNPTTQIPYDPNTLQQKDLLENWPNTPLSQTGLSESVIQKIQWLARRLPGGYRTPRQIAEDYKKGKFTWFESEEEKVAVLEVAAELAKEDADKVTERCGEVVEPRDMSLNSISSKQAEKRFLLDEVVRGDFEELEKQRYAFMDTVAKALRNNETYGSTQAEKFMNRIYELIPQGRGQQQEDKANKK